MYKESETIELKQELNKNIKKEIVAFANSKGGTIYLGITDDGKIKGLDNIDDDVEALSGMIRDGIIRDLTTYTDIEPKNIDGKDIIELHITSAPEKPYYLADKGLKPSGVYIRHGSSSIQATDEIIRKMMIDSSERNFEEEISKEQNLTFNYAKTVFESKKIEFSENKYKSLKMITDGKYNNLALLLSDQNPYTIKCAIFQGTNKILFQDRKEMTGSYLKIIEDTEHYMELSNRIKSDFKGFTRVDKKDYPSYSLREALLNAIMHRDYNFSGSILLSIFDDRIEINSTGGLLSTLSLNDVYNGVSESRNPNLAELFHRLDYVENYGTGIGRILEEYNDFKIKPTIELTENVFKIVLPNRNYIKQSEAPKYVNEKTQEEQIIDYLKEYSKASRTDLENLLGIGKTRTVEVINNLLDSKLILKQGSGKNTYYILK